MINAGASFGTYREWANVAQFEFTQMTVMCWAYPVATNAYHACVTRGPLQNPGEFALGVSNSAGRWRFALRVGATQYNAASGTSFSINTLYHLCGTYDKSNVRLYVNGSNAATTACTGDFPTSTNPIRLFERMGDSNSHFGGNIGEIAIWNVPLTAAEITILSNRVSPLLVRPQNLVLYDPGFANSNNRIGGTTKTEVGTITSTAHPRIYWPQGSEIGIPTVSSPPSSTITPWHLFNRRAA